MKGRELVVGVCGGIAAFKTAALVSQLVQAGAGVTVVMTGRARKFVGHATFEALTGRNVVTRVFDGRRYPLGPHIELAERCELLCVAPATANLLGQAAHGLAPDLLSTLMLSFPGPILMAPSMNTTMWEKPSVQRNMEQLKKDGVHFMPPEEGWLSCRTTGAGRMAEPDAIRMEIQKILDALPRPNR